MAFQGKDVLPEKRSGYTYQGKEIILSETRGRPPQGLVRKGMEIGVFPQEKEIEIATVYAVVGDLNKVAELTKTNVQHLKKLVKTEGFRQLLKEIREENAEKFDAKFSKIVEKSQEELLDRIENGDVKLTNKGEQVRVPVPARDLVVIQAITFDKLQLQRGKPTSRVETTDNSRLELLAQKFLELAKPAKEKEKQVLDGEYVEVVNESK